MDTSFSKPIILFLLFSFMIFKSNAQAPGFKSNELYAFNFKTASAALSGKTYTISDIAPAATGKKPKMTHEKKMKIAGAVLVSLGACALAGAITGGVIYGRQLYGKNRTSNSDDLKPVLRFYGILAGGTIVSNTLIGVGAWMIADN